MKATSVVDWIHIYDSVVRNIPIAILLYATSSEVLSIQLLDTLNADYFKTASTLAVLITVIPYMILQNYRLGNQAEAA